MDLYNLVVSAKLSKGGGGGGDIDVESLSVTENGTYTAPSGKAYSPVNVSVPNSYAAGDEGKVVQNGALVSQTSTTKTANGTYDTTTNDEVVVNVPGPSGTISITENGNNIDVSQYANANVNVPTGGGGGGGTPKLSGVNFIDYDGSLVQHYTADEFAALTALPANPTHSGLTAQGWNWTLANAKAYVAKYGNLNIGQSYITTSGKTEIDISLQDGRLALALGIGLNGTMEIDWGDGSTPDTVTGTSVSTAKYTDHTYAAAGDYTIKLDITGTASILGNSSQGSYLITKPTTVSATGMKYYANSIQSVRIGEGVTSIGNNAFYDCYSLASVTIPEGVTSIGNNAFYNCYLLASVTIPEGVTNISGGVFEYCYSLASVTIPEGVTNIGGEAFGYCYPLASVTIPEGVTSIGGSAFQTCSSLAYIRFLPTTVPTLASTNAFSSIAADCVFYVPSASLADYQAATNWSNYASRMVGE